jgi:glycosyltransferase involved in cell wall biosynthesis
LRVCHVSPTYFSRDSVVGGGERFPEELSKAMSKRATVKFISFGKQAAHEVLSPTYERIILKSWSSDSFRPFSPILGRHLRGADVIHCHQYYVLSTFLAAWLGARQKSRVFVSDLGGGGWTPGFQIDQSRWLTGHLPISVYASRSLPGRLLPSRVIYCGVDLSRYRVRSAPEHDGSIVFLGRVLPHKGIHFLIAGLPSEMTLHIIGSERDPSYLRRLETMAPEKKVHFHAGLSDEEVGGFLRRAMALVHPTPVDQHGDAGANELFGLAPIEAMASGCPPVVSAVASLTESVVHEQSGLHVPPNEPAAIGRALQRLAGDPTLWRRLSAGARRRVETLFTWDSVSDRCLAAYAEDYSSSATTTAPEATSARRAAGGEDSPVQS